MRILQFVQQPQRRGAEVFAFQLSSELRRRGNDVGVVYLYDYVGDGRLPVGEGDHVLYGRYAHPLERIPGVHPVLLRRVLAAIDTFQPDIVQLNGARTVKYGAIARRLRAGQRWRMVYRNIGNPSDWIRSVPKRLFYRRAFSAADGTVALSKQALAAISAISPQSGPRVVISNAIDPQELKATVERNALRSSLATPADAPVLLFVGSLAPEKRVDLLLDSFGRLRSMLPDAVLWVAGGGPLRESLEEEARVKGLWEHVHFLGVRSDIGSLMVSADILALTSDTEGVPAVVLEAGYHGLPVVATDVGGIRECVINGSTGTLVEAGNATALAGAFYTLLSDQRLREAIGDRARELIRTRFTIERVADQYMTFYEQICGG